MMEECRSKVPVLFIALFFCTVFMPAASADRGGYTVEPVTQGMETGTQLETVQIDFWDLPPRIMILSIAFSISPLVLFPVELLFFVKMVAFFGYRKITTHTVLDNDVRSSAFSCIRHNPGICFSNLSQKTEIRPGSLKYHLAILKRTNKITVLDAHGHTCYFENSGKYSAFEQKVLKSLRNESERAIFEHLISNPETTRSDLEKMLRISGATVTWHTNRLCDAGMLTVTRRGRTARYAINPDAMKYLEKYLVTMTGNPVVDSSG